MKLPSLKSYFATAALAISTLGLVSCGPSIQPLSSTPPAKGLKVNEFSWGDGILLKKFTFPSGTYVPEGEDKKGYYYAPQNAQVKVSDTGMRYGTKGGIYWKKELPQPEALYVSGNFGMMAQLPKKDLPVSPIR